MFTFPMDRGGRVQPEDGLPVDPFTPKGTYRASSEASASLRNILRRWILNGDLAPCYTPVEDGSSEEPVRQGLGCSCSI